MSALRTLACSSYNHPMPPRNSNRCLVCDYDLRGLPTPHRCPECGFEYDQHTHVWPAPHPWTGTAARLLLGTIVLACCVRAGLVAFRVGSSTLVWLGLLAIVTVALIAVIPAAWSIRRRGRFIAITPFGIIVRTAQRDERIAWNAVRGVVPDGRKALIRWRDDAGTGQLEYDFGTPQRVSEFRARFERALQRYGHASRMVTPTHPAPPRKKSKA